MKILNTTDGKYLGKILPNNLSIGDVIELDNAFIFYIQNKINVGDRIVLSNNNYIIELME